MLCILSYAILYLLRDHFMLGHGYMYTSHYAIASVICISQLCRMPSSCYVAAYTKRSLKANTGLLCLSSDLFALRKYPCNCVTGRVWPLYVYLQRKRVYTYLSLCLEEYRYDFQHGRWVYLPDHFLIGSLW